MSALSPQVASRMSPSTVPTRRFEFALLILARAQLPLDDQRIRIGKKKKSREGKGQAGAGARHLARGAPDPGLRYGLNQLFPRKINANAFLRPAANDRTARLTGRDACSSKPDEDEH
jgi:hypothetical protein